MADCTWPLDPVIGQLIEIDRAAAASTGAEFLDLIPWFCAAGRCPLVVNNMVTSYGSEHVTNTYALALTDRLRLALDLG